MEDLFWKGHKSIILNFHKYLKKKKGLNWGSHLKLVREKQVKGTGLTVYWSQLITNFESQGLNFQDFEPVFKQIQCFSSL